MLLGHFAAAILFVEIALPPLFVGELLPGREECMEMIHLNWQYRCKVEEFIGFVGPYRQARQALYEAKVLYDFWDDCRDVRSQYYSTLKRRWILARLIRELGIERILQQDWPAPVPGWR